MNVHLNAVIIDADPVNRQELAKFLTAFGVTLAAQYPTLDSLASILSRSDAPQLAIINLDPGAPGRGELAGPRPSIIPCRSTSNRPISQRQGVRSDVPCIAISCVVWPLVWSPSSACR